MSALAKTVVVAILALASAAQDTSGCAGVQLFVAPCTVFQAGETITQAEAFKAISRIVNDNALTDLSSAIRGYTNFTTEVFEDIPGCQIPLTESCGFLSCCDAGNPGRRLQGMPFFGCKIWTILKGGFSAPKCLPPSPGEEAVVTVCIEEKCTGLLLQDADLLEARNQVCGEDVTESCTTSTCPPCIQESCCNDERRSRSTPVSRSGPRSRSTPVSRSGPRSRSKPVSRSTPVSRSGPRSRSTPVSTSRPRSFTPSSRSPVSRSFIPRSELCHCKDCIKGSSSLRLRKKEIDSETVIVRPVGNRGKFRECKCL